ncbi:glycerophosphodiester phosphodiesterase [Heyndrickxia sporothermodurans]|uniref:Glycerophosphodiester phosphodiesterase n=1 Tax=Heyndrickxia sporothermodurans TaxID=46224 RepID=A0A150KP95_9BACI|nr:glycerophosphodiester phosphodiesterase [Heyndrickxia sporothermodurans]KYC95120.1 Glycerophosphoryl diester phosphodiesterase [Heyndrickxia sporothermodurans]MBL5766007.1 glycerophosphodiester phosphodiesterase [Heyndrickxia sporothermodurans]MBL5769448.1 glycerophosphodiester phosphodiesterase [Heyndrickxia sporothermodurans]MBL5773229.1 glycerophosphodiester phosphodiesterase [Heyndrickxia sporothermodurans]MBL5777139.1 glycerophosphodiester phosphodiesterase [Heyndrickxia sporothermodur
MTFIFAHRGSAGTHPENTMESFIAAEKSGAEGLELDVHLSKDGEIVVIHDETVDRTTNGKGFVHQLTVAELKELNASYKFKTFQSFIRSPKIPTLKEVFEWMRGNNLLCNIEMKNGKIMYPLLEEKVIQLIRDYRYEERIIISSFNHYSLVRCYQLAPELETAPLYSDGLYMPWIYAKAIHSKGLHPNFKAAPNMIIQEAMANGIAVRPYTVNKESDMERLIAIQCSAIITDYPEKAFKIRKKLSK